MVIITETGQIVSGTITERGVGIVSARLSLAGKMVFGGGTLRTVQLSDVQHILDPACSDEQYEAQ